MAGQCCWCIPSRDIGWACCIVVFTSPFTPFDTISHRSCKFVETTPPILLIKKFIILECYQQKRITDHTLSPPPTQHSSTHIHIHIQHDLSPSQLDSCRHCQYFQCTMSNEYHDYAKRRTFHGPQFGSVRRE